MFPMTKARGSHWLLPSLKHFFPWLLGYLLRGFLYFSYHSSVVHPLLHLTLNILVLSRAFLNPLHELDIKCPKLNLRFLSNLQPVPVFSISVKGKKVIPDSSLYLTTGQPSLMHSTFKISLKSIHSPSASLVSPASGPSPPMRASVTAS